MVVATPLLRPVPGGHDSIRSSDRCGAEASVRGSVGTRSTRPPSARRAFGASPCASSNVVALDLASFSSQLSVLGSRFQILQYGQPWIFPIEAAFAAAAIQVRAAHRTQSAAFGTTERFHRQRQIELLAHEVPEVDFFVFVEGCRKIFLLNLEFALTDVDRLRVINKIKARLDGPQKRFQTAAARQLEYRLDEARQAKSLSRFGHIEVQLHRCRDPVLIVRNREPL